MRRILASVVAVGMTVIAVPSHAEPAGCEIVATGYGTGGCTYTATGPGEYLVVSASGFRVEITSPPERKQTLVAHPVYPNAPHTGVVAASGTLATQAGDVVVLAITIGEVRPDPGQDPIWRYQDGYGRAGDVS